MNKIFKVIWSKSKQCYIVVSEIAKNKTGKKKIVVAGIFAALAMVGGLQSVEAANASGSGSANAVAWGSSSKAPGDNAIAIGKGANAAKNNTIAIGTNSKANLDMAVAVGNEASADTHGTSIGASAKTTGYGAFAGGVNAQANGVGAIAIGGATSDTYNQNAVATGESATAIGSSAIADGRGGVAVGWNAESKVNAVSIGFNAKAKANNTVAIGVEANNDKVNAISNNYSSVSIGVATRARAVGSMAMGVSADASGNYSIALGSGDVRGDYTANVNYPKATGEKAIAIGYNSNSSNTAATAIGAGATASGQDSFAGGSGTAGGNSSIAIGKSSGATNDRALAVGVNAKATGKDTVAVGSGAGGTVGLGFASRIDDNKGVVQTIKNINVATTADGDNAVAVGHYANAMNSGVALGQNTLAATGGVAIGKGVFEDTNNVDAGGTVIGQDSTVTGFYSLAVGRYTFASGSTSMAMGYDASAKGNYAVAMGRKVIADGTSTAIGHHAVATNGGLAIGSQDNDASKDKTTASASGAVAIGKNTQSTLKGAVALGSDSTTATSATKQESVTINGITYNFAGATSDTGMQVSVGAAGKERQIKNVAAGEVSATSTDAINGSQLFAVASQIKPIQYFSVNSSVAENKDNTGATGSDSVAIGPKAKAQAMSSIALGNNATAAGGNSIAIGNTSSATDKQSPISIGYGATANGDFSVAVGGGDNNTNYGATANGVGGTALGGKTKTTGGNFQTAVGFGATTTAANASAFGYNATTSVEGGVALGSNSSSTTGVNKGYNPNDNRTNKYNDLNGNVLTSTTGAIAVGNGSTVTRQITGVAAGTNDTDAVNVAQLKSVNLAFKGNVGSGDVNLATNEDNKKLAIKGDASYITTTANGNTITISGKKQDIHVLNGIASANAEGMADVKNVATAINNAISQNKYKWYLTADNDTAGSRATIDKEGTVKFSGDPNITVARNSNTITTSLNKAITVDSVKASKSVIAGSGNDQITLDGTSGTIKGKTFSGQSFVAGNNVLSNTTLQIGSTTNGDNNVTISRDGFSSKAGTKSAKFGATGIDAGGQVIANVSSGGNVGSNAANITDVKNYVGKVALDIKSNSKTGTINLEQGALGVIGANGIRTDLNGTGNSNLIIGLDSNTVNATTKGIGLSGDSGTMLKQYLKDGDANYKISGDGALVSTSGTTTGVQVSVDKSKVKDLAIEAVTVSKANTVDNPITVTPTASTNSKDYAIGIDTTKLAAKTNLAYTANGGTAKPVSLAKGLNFVDGSSTVATVDNDGKVSFDLNTATKNQINTNTTDIATNKSKIATNTTNIAANTTALTRNISLGADTGAKSSQSLSTADVAFNVKGASGDFISTKMNGNNVEVSTKRAPIDSDANNGTASVTGADGLATAKNVADAINNAVTKSAYEWKLSANGEANPTTVGKGDIVDFTGGSNITVERDNKNISVKLNKNLTNLSSVSIGNNIAETIKLDGSNGGITANHADFKNNTGAGTSIDSSGIRVNNGIADLTQIGMGTISLDNGNGSNTIVTTSGVTLTDGSNVSEYNAKGIAFGDPTGTNTAQFGLEGISAANQQIKDVAAGTDDTDVVNVKQLKDTVGDQKLNISDGTNNSSVALKNQKLTITGTGAAKATVNGQTITIDVAEGTLTPNTTDGTVTGTTGVAKATEVAAAINNTNTVLGDKIATNTTNIAHTIALADDKGTSTTAKSLKDGNVSFAVTGDGNLVSTSATAAGVKVSVDAAKVKDLAVAAVTVSKDGQTDNPITVTPTAGTNSMDYAIGIDTTKLAAKTDLTYRANSAADANAKKVSLSKGLNFVDGDSTVATVDNDGKVSFDLNTTTKNQINTNTTDIAANKGNITKNTAAIATNTAALARNISLGADTGTASSQSLSTADVAFNVKGATGDFVSTNMNGNTVEISTKRATINSNATTGEASVTGNDGLATAQNVADAINKAADAAKAGAAWNITTNSSTTDKTAVKGGDTVDLVDGDNIEITQDGTDKKKITVATKKDITVDSVTANNKVTVGSGANKITLDGTDGSVTGKAFTGTTFTGTLFTGTSFTAGNTVINTNGLTNGTTAITGTGVTTDNVTVGGISIDKTAGINAGNKVISNVDSGGTTLTNAANIGDVQNAVANLSQNLNITDGTHNGTVNLKNQKLNVAGANGVTATVNNQTITVGLDADTVNATTKGIGLTADTGSTGNKYLKDGDVSFAVTGDGNLVSTSATTAGVKVAVDAAKVKDLAIDAVTVSKDAQADNPITVTPTVGTNSKDYAIGIDTTKLAGKTDLTYRANNDTDANAKKVSLAKGLNFVNGTLATASIDNDGVVKYDVNTATITAGTDGTVTGPTTDGVATAQNVADAINAAKKASKTEITANTGEAANATTGNVTLTSTNAADGHTIYDVKLNNKVTLGTATNAVTIDGTTGKVTAKNAVIGGVTVDGDNKHVTGLSNTTWNGTATTGRAATEDQLKAVADTAKATTDAVNLKFSGDTNTAAGVVNLKDDTFNIVGDGKYVTTDANGKDLTVKVSEAEVKKSAVAAVTVSTDTTDANNPLTVTPTTSADGTTKDYKVTIDGTKIANKTNLSYKANDGTAKQVSLADGLNFKNGTKTTASIDDNGVVKYDVNTAAITAGADGTITGPTTDGVATAKNVADAINAAKKASKTEVTANTGEAANATTGNVSLTSTTAADGHTIYDVKLNDKVTLGTGANAVTIDGATGAITGKTATIGGVTVNGTANTIGGLSNTTWNGTATTGRAATEDQLKAVADAAGSQTWEITADKKAGTSGVQTGTKENAKVGKDDTVSLIAGENLTVDQASKNFTYSLNKDLVKMNSATFEATGGKTTVIKGDSIVQTDGANVNTTNATSNTITDGTNTSTITAGKAQIGTVGIDGIDSKITTGGTNAVVVNGADGTIKTGAVIVTGGTTNDITGLSNTTVSGADFATKGRAATEEQLKAATEATTLKFTGDVATNTGSVNLKDDTFGIKGDGKYISTDVNGKNVNLTVSEAEVKKSAVAAVTVSTDTTDANNPLTVTPTTSADGTTKEYKVTIDGTKIANKTNLSYKANNGTAKQVSLADGLDFTNGTLTTASIDNNGVVKYDVNTAAITAGADGTITGPTTDGIATAKNVADAINAAKKASKTEVTANTGEAANATTGNVTLTSTTAADGHIIYDVKLNDKVTLGTGANAVTIDGTTGAITGKTANIGGVTVNGTANTIGGLSNTTWNGTATTGRAATEDQLKAVADAAGSQTWNITADKAGTTGNQTGTKKNATVGKDETVELVAGDNLTINQDERKFTYSLNKDLANLTSVSVGNGTTETIKLDGATGKITAKNASIGGVTIDGDNNHVTGLSNTTWNGTATTGRAATEDQLKAVADTAKITTDAVNLKFSGDTNTSPGVVNLKDDTLGIIGDGKYVSTDANGKNLTVKVSEAEVKKSAVAAVTVSTDTTDTNNPLTVIPTASADGTTKDYKVTIDGTKIANKTNLSYKANDGTAKQVSLADGLNFKNGTLTTASIDDNGVVKYDVNTAAITAGADGTITGPTTDGVATAQNVADAINAAKKASKTEITANTGEAANATTGNVTLTSTTAADGHTIYDVKLNDKVTLGTGANAVIIDGTAGKATIGSSIIDGVNNTFTTGGASPVTLNGATGTITGKAANIGGVTVNGTANTIGGLSNTTWNGTATTGRAATEDQLKAVADAAGSQTWEITADKKAGTSGAQTGTKENAKVGKDDKVSLIAGENLTVDQASKNFTYSLNKDLVKMNSATFEATGGKTTVIKGDSIVQTDGANVNTSNATSNTITDGTNTSTITAGKAQIGTVDIDGVASKITTGGTNAVVVNGADGTVKTGNVTVTGGTTNDITGLSNTTLSATDFATKGRAATEEQLKAATGATTLKFTGDVATNTGSVNLKDDTFGIKGDNKYISTDVNGKNVNLTVSEAEVKKSAVAAVTVSTDTTDVDNPLTVTPNASADGTTKDYKVTIDGTKIANKTNLSYKANDGTAKQVSLADGLNFKNGTLTTASIDDNGVVKYDVNTASITAGADGTITGPTTDGVATAQNVADAINAAKKASKTELTANTGEAANATTGNVTLTSITAADGHTIYDVKLNDKVTLGTGANAVTIDGTAGKATIGTSIVDGVNNTFTTGGASPVTLNGATGTITGKTANIGGVTVDGTNNHVMGLANKDWTPGVTQAVSGRAATEDQLQKVSDAVGAGWKVNTGKVTGSTGESNGAASTKVASGEEVQFQAGNNLIVDQNGKTVAYSLNKALKDLESATFNGNGTNKTVITGDSITQTAGTQTNISTAAGNTIANGTKSTETTADGQVIKDGAKSNKSTVDSNVIDDGNGNKNTSTATSNTITDGTNTSNITAGKATIGSSIIDGVNNTFTTGGANAVTLDGATGTITGTTANIGGVTVNGTAKTVNGLSNTTWNGTAVSGRAATEDQLKAVGEQTWQITADKKTGTSGAQTGLKENAKVGKDDKVSLIAGENLTVDQAGKNFTYSLNTDLVKMNSATFEATGGKTTVIKGDSIVQTDGTKTNTATASGNTVANGTKSTETTADGQVIKDGTKTNTSTVDENTIVDGTKSNKSTVDSNTITDGTNTTETTSSSVTVKDNVGNSTVITKDNITTGVGGNKITLDGTAGKATIGSSIVDGVNNTFTTGGISPVTLNGATGTITGKTANIGGVTVDGTNNHVMGLANKDWTPGVTQAVSGRAATEDQLQKVSDAVGAGWKVNTGKVTGSTGESNGAASTKVASGEEVQFQAGNNLIVDQNGKTVAYSLNKVLKDLESATFNGTGTNKTVITGDSITQTAGTQTNTSTAGGNTVVDGTKSTETTAAGQVIKDGTKTNTSTVDENTIVDGTKSNKSTVDGNTITDGTNTTATTSNSVTVKDNAGNSTIITKDNVTTGVGANKITLDGTAGKATIGSSIVDGVNNTFTTGGANAVKLDGAAGTIKTGAVTVTGGTTNDITGLSNTTVNSADFATKGRAATEEQLKAVGEQTWQITADKDAATSGVRTGIKKDTKVGKDNKVQLIAGENMTINQNERDFTFTLNKDLVKMNSATFLGTGSNTTVITGNSITQTAGTQTNTSTAGGNTVVDGTKSTETTAAGQVIKDGAKSNKSTVDSNVIDDGNGNKNISNATSNTITDGTNTSTITAGKANIGNIAVDGVNNKITMGNGATPVILDGANGHLDGLTNTTWVPGVTKATTGRAATEDQLQQVSDAVGAGWKVNTGTVAGSSGVSNGAASTKVSSGEEVKLQAGDNLVIDQNGKTVSYSLNKDLTKMNSATFEATGGKTTVVKGDSIVQTDGGKTNTSNAAGNTVVDGNKSTATTAAGTTITDGAKTNTSTADKNVIDDGAGNKSTFTKDGVTITKTGKDTVSLTSNGLDNGNNKIVNVAAGVANTDAVNVGQLKEYATKSTTELTANNGEAAGSTTGNIVLTKTTAFDGHTIYNNKLNDKITLGTDPTKAVTVDGTTGTVTGLTNKTWTPGSIVSGRAATEDQLKDAVADSGWKAAVDKEGSGQSNVVGTSPEKIKAEETVTFKAGNNMMVTQTGKSISYAVNPELTNMTSATFKDAAGNTTVTNGNGITITLGSANPTNPHAGPVSLTKDGLNNGNNQIKGVAPGTDSTDAVNVAQLNASNANTSQAINQVAGEVQHVGAHAAAMAALKPIQYDPLEPTQIMAGVGNYRGETAAALGLAHYTNENTMFNVGVSVGGNHNMVNAGVTHKFGYSPEKKNIPDRYKAGPISSVYVMQDEVSSLKKENAEQKYVIADQAARLTTLEAENEQQRRELAETKKGLDDLKAAVDKLLASKG